MIQRRFIPVFIVAATVLFLFYYHSTTIKETWRGLPQRVGLGDNFEEVQDPSHGEQHDPIADPKNWNPTVDFHPGESKPGNYNFSTMLVMATTKDNDMTWVTDSVPNQDITMYVADDPTAEFHPPKNKGHEVMIYLSWIIDNYDHLPDVTMFMHWHRYTWHNNEILGLDASEMVKRLNPNRVIREGYMNLRCHWHPGCPDWMHPGDMSKDGNRPEQRELAKAWSELFPFNPIPEVLAGMCCAQFALSAERIRSLPLARYVFYRDWILRTRLSDYISGRIWEYAWHFIFTGKEVHCPEEWICYCDGYGLCFGGVEKYDEYQRIRGDQRGWEGKLHEWNDKKKKIEDAQKKIKEAKDKHDQAKEREGIEELKKAEKERPEPGKDKVFSDEIDRLGKILAELRAKAFKRGEDPKIRAEELGREWNEGDGF